MTTRLRSAVGTADRGMSLIELLVTMILMAVVGSLVLGAVIQSTRILVRTDDEATGLGDAKVVLDRVGRDIREARSTECDGGLADPTDPTSTDPDCRFHLQLWIDSNSDYARQETEVVTWRLQKNPDGIHYDVWRVQGTGAGGTPQTARRQASSLVVQTVFTYDTADFDKVELIKVGMTYDAIVGQGADLREVGFSARLRNKG